MGALRGEEDWSRPLGEDAMFAATEGENSPSPRSPSPGGLGFPINLAPFRAEIGAKEGEAVQEAPTGILRPCLRADGVRARE